MADLTTNLGKLSLKNPVMTASGTFGYGYEWDGYHAYFWPGAPRNSFVNISYTF